MCLSELAAMRIKDMQGFMQQWRHPPYRAKQVLEWRNKGVLDPDLMLNLPQPLRDQLEKHIVCQPLSMVDCQIAEDGVRKYLFERHDGRRIETVFIPELSRGTVCVSTQVGCVFDCPFCNTGLQKFNGNLTAGEIVAQILAIKHDLRENPPETAGSSVISHIVYMGMGEPLANEENVHQSLIVLMDPHGISISRRRITVSTSGILPAIQRLGAQSPVNLAVSLHAAINEKRDILVPINKKYPLDALRESLDAYPLGTQRHITLEYVMLKDVNDQPEDLQALKTFVNPQRERLNLINFNPFEQSSYQASSKEHVDQFAKQLIEYGIRTTIRRSRGQDIMAACGQLHAKQEDLARQP